MILPGSTAFTKTLGQQSDAIYTTNMTGNWIPTTGINTHYWDNQVSSGNNLRRFNGITHSTTDPDHFLFDGSNDYLGNAADDYGGDPFLVDPSTDYTIGEWFKYNNVSHYIFQIIESEISGTDYSVDLQVLTSNDQAKLIVKDIDNEVDFNITFSNFTFSDDTWYYGTLVHDSGDYYFYVNGSFVGSKISGGAVQSLDQQLFIGRSDLGNLSVVYTGANTKVGHVHVYSRALTNSQIRQNFLATHEIHSDRVYGNSYTK